MTNTTTPPVPIAVGERVSFRDIDSGYAVTGVVESICNGIARVRTGPRNVMVLAVRLLTRLAPQEVS